MKRTNIYLTETQRRQLMAAADYDATSMAEIVRAAIDYYFDKHSLMQLSSPCGKYERVGKEEG